MIQTTAPTLTASVLQTTVGAGAVTVAGLPGGDFAALLDLLPQPSVGTASETGVVAPSFVHAALNRPQGLGDALKGTQQGLAALALQAGAAAYVPPARAVSASMDGATPGAAEPGSPPSGTGPSAITACPGPGAAPAPAPVSFVPGKPIVPALGEAVAPTGSPAAPQAAALPPEPGALAKSPKSVSGKDGKLPGKILPSRQEAGQTLAGGDTKIEAAQPFLPGEAPMPDPRVAADPDSQPPTTSPASQPLPASLAEARLATATAFATPAPSRPNPGASSRASRSPVVAEAGKILRADQASMAQVRAARLEPIEIVAVAPDQAQPPAATPQPGAGPKPEAAKFAPASETLASPVIATRSPTPHGTERPAPLPAPVGIRASEGPLPSPASASSAATPAKDARNPAPALDAPILVLTPADQPQRQPSAPRVQVEEGVASMSQAARAPLPPATPTHTAVADEQGAGAERPPEPLPNLERRPAGAPKEHALASATEPDRTPVIRHDPQVAAQPIMSDAGPGVVVTPTDGVAMSPPARSETPQDFDTLVSRLAEARDAATPHVVRTAMAHGEFGRVSLQIDHSEGGLAVTLASRDPEFAGAVQVAAAAMASNASTAGDQPRQDGAGGQQSQNQSQNQAHPGQQGTAGSAGQGQQPRADTSGQAPRRESGGFPRQQDQQQPGTPARAPREPRSGSGVYA